MKMDPYIDPPNLEEIKVKISNIKTLGKIQDFVNEVFPGWIVTFVPSFSQRYPIFNKTWKTVCEKINIRPAQIMIVDMVVFDENHKLINMFSEIFTRSGFAVRSKDHFLPCKKCGLAYPNGKYHTLLGEKGEDVPVNWGCCID